MAYLPSTIDTKEFQSKYRFEEMSKEGQEDFNRILKKLQAFEKKTFFYRLLNQKEIVLLIAEMDAVFGWELMLKRRQ